MADIEVAAVSKVYGQTWALQEVSLQVEPGELFGLIGPDGAGKTTLMRIICTLLTPTSGQVRVKNLDVTTEVSEVRSLLGYMPQRFSLYPDLTVEQNLNFFAELFEVPPEKRRSQIERLYRFSRLAPFKKRKAAALSGGMKQKLALSCALVHTPEVLVLDEPTYGVDPVSRSEFWEILRQIKAEGTTILVSTAYMEEAELCDRVALMLNGRIVGRDTPDNLRRSYPYPLFRLQGADLPGLQNFFAGKPEVKSVQRFGDSLHVSFATEPSAEDWQRYRRDSGGLLRAWRPQPPSIEDVFFARMGERHEQP